EGARGRRRPAGRHAGLRRLLPVRRWAAARDPRGRDGDHPAGRVGARSRGRRGGGRGGDLDGPDPSPPFPALMPGLGSPRSLAAVTAATRIGLGAALLVAPGRLAAAWTG